MSLTTKNELTSEDLYEISRFLVRKYLTTSKKAYKSPFKSMRKKARKEYFYYLTLLNLVDQKDQELKQKENDSE